MTFMSPTGRSRRLPESRVQAPFEFGPPHVSRELYGPLRVSNHLVYRPETVAHSVPTAEYLVRPCVSRGHRWTDKLGGNNYCTDCQLAKPVEIVEEEGGPRARERDDCDKSGHRWTEKVSDNYCLNCKIPSASVEAVLPALQRLSIDVAAATVTPLDLVCPRNPYGHELRSGTCYDKGCRARGCFLCGWNKPFQGAKCQCAVRDTCEHNFGGGKTVLPNGSIFWAPPFGSCMKCGKSSGGHVFAC